MQEVARLIHEDKLELAYSKKQILANVEEIRKKSFKNSELGTSLKANKEIAELQGHYDRDAGDKGNYLTLIEQLVVNNTTITQGSEPKQVEHDIEAEFEDV